MLSSYRVLDLTDGHALFAGALLADLGADVIQVEPPGGALSRGWRTMSGAPMPAGDSPTWLAFARNKRGIALDLTTPNDRNRLLDLASTADALIESQGRDVLAGLGLGYAEVRARNPAIVYTSITPYGQTGPKADWPSSDLTLWASAGFQFPNGDADRAPLRIAVPQAYIHAALDAALGTLIALRERKQSGLGQHVDIAAQHSAVMAALPNQLATAYRDPSAVYTRMARGSTVGGRSNLWAYPAADGLVSVLVLFGSVFGPPTARLFRWICEEGYCDTATRDKDWIHFGERLTSGEEPPGELARVQQIVEQFVASKTKRELFAAAFEQTLLIAPWYTIEDARNDPQLAARGFWTPAAPGDTDGPRYPGPFVRFTESPIQYRRPAPAPGEHDADVTPADRPAPSLLYAGTTRNARPLEGVKILDFGRVYVTPASIRPLADFGATVIRVNSTIHTDAALTLAPMWEGVFEPTRAGIFHDGNAGKLSIALDTTTPAGQEVARQLVGWADVIAEGFTPRVMRKFGLDYASLREEYPRLIYMSSSLCGHTGPYAGLAGYGTAGSSLSAINTMIGWPDRLPCGTAGAYTDIGTPRFITAAILAALEYRDRTGRGQLIDLAHIETGIHLIAPAFVERELTGVEVRPQGNRSPDMAPHGCFAAAGDDRWVAIAVADDAQWERLCRVAGMERFACDPALQTLDGRKACEDAIEREIEQWTRTRPAEAIVEALIAAGVAASVVAGPDDIYYDPQLRHRQALIAIPDRHHGEIVVQGPRIRLSRTPASVTRTGSVGGDDSDYILSEILGYSGEEITRLAASGALH